MLVVGVLPMGLRTLGYKVYGSVLYYSGFTVPNLIFFRGHKLNSDQSWGAGAVAAEDCLRVSDATVLSQRSGTDERMLTGL